MRKVSLIIYLTTIYAFFFHPLCLSDEISKTYWYEIRNFKKNDNSSDEIIKFANLFITNIPNGKEFETYNKLQGKYKTIISDNCLEENIKLKSQTSIEFNSVADFIKLQKKDLDLLTKCYQNIFALYNDFLSIDLYTNLTIENKLFLHEDRKIIEQIIKENNNQLAHSEKPKIQLSKPIPELSLTIRPSVLHLDLRQHFDIHVNGIEKDKDKLSFSAECDFKHQLANGTVEKLEGESEENPIVLCNVSDGILKVSSNTVFQNTTKIKIIASYPGNEEIIEYPTLLTVNIGPRRMGERMICADWNCNYFSGFFLGVEGASVSSLQNEAFLRYEFSTYSNISDRWHIFGRIYQSDEKVDQPTAGNENLTACRDSDNNLVTGCEETLEEAIFGEVGINNFWGARADLKKKDALLIGPTIQYRIYKANVEDEEFEEEYYLGWRMAYSKIQYFDFLYGFEEEVIRLKGQLPVINNNLLVGVDINFSAGSKNDGENTTPDSIRAFITYEVDFSQFIKR